MSDPAPLRASRAPRAQHHFPACPNPAACACRERGLRLLAGLERQRDHGLSLDDWAELQRLIDPGEYDEPPPPLTSAAVLSTEARIAVMRKRVAAGRSPYHPADLWRLQPTADGLHVGVLARHHERNGSDQEGPLAARRAA